MATEQNDKLLAEFGLHHRRPPELFRSAALKGYTHVFRRAWKSFDNLRGVLSVRGRPTVYLPEHDREGRISLKDHRRFWSNGVAPILVRVTPQEVQV